MREGASLPGSETEALLFANAITNMKVALRCCCNLGERVIAIIRGALRVTCYNAGLVDLGLLEHISLEYVVLSWTQIVDCNLWNCYGDAAQQIGCVLCHHWDGLKWTHSLHAWVLKLLHRLQLCSSVALKKNRSGFWKFDDCQQGNVLLHACTRPGLYCIILVSHGWHAAKSGQAR